MKRTRLSGRFIKKSKLEKITKGKEALASYHKNCMKESDDSDKCSVSGNRIINIAYLSKQLVCTKCNYRLHLEFIKEEVKFGLASTFKIESDKCFSINHIHTSQRVSGKKSVKALLDINCRAALACIDAGFGHDPLIRFFENIDISPPTVKTLKKAENEMGDGFVTVATDSFRKAIEEEKALTIIELEASEYIEIQGLIVQSGQSIFC